MDTIKIQLKQIPGKKTKDCSNEFAAFLVKSLREVLSSGHEGKIVKEYAEPCLREITFNNGIITIRFANAGGKELSSRISVHWTVDILHILQSSVKNIFERSGWIMSNAQPSFDAQLEDRTVYFTYDKKWYGFVRYTDKHDIICDEDKTLAWSELPLKEQKYIIEDYAVGRCRCPVCRASLAMRRYPEKPLAPDARRSFPIPEICPENVFMLDAYTPTDGREWKELLSRHNEIRFYDGEAETEIAAIKRIDEKYKCIIDGNNDEDGIVIDREFCDYFAVSYYEWLAMERDHTTLYGAEVKGKSVQLLEEYNECICNQKLNASEFLGLFSLQAKGFSRKAFLRINSDFISLHPGSRIEYGTKKGFVDYHDFALGLYRKNHYGLITGIPYRIIGKEKLNGNICIKFHEYLNNFTREDKNAAKSFKQHYMTRTNVFISEECS